MLRPKYSFQPVMTAPLQRFVTGDRLQSTLAAAAKQSPVLRAGDELDDLFTGLDVRQYHSEASTMCSRVLLLSDHPSLLSVA
jgi:hypothetical protein